MELYSKMQKRILNFLMEMPNLQYADSQQAFIYSASLDPQLQAQIPFGRPQAEFVPILFSKLLKYGLLSDGRHPLIAVLETAKNYIGQNKVACCEDILKELDALGTENWSKSFGVMAELQFCENLYLEGIIQGKVFEFNTLYVDILIKGEEISVTDDSPLPFEVDIGRLIQWTGNEEGRRKEISECSEVELSISKALRKYQKLVILGDSGTGKTTALRWATWHFARMRKEGNYNFIPVYVPLSAYRKGTHSINVLVAQALQCQDWKKLPVSFFFFLDGLNEIPIEDRDRASKELQEFLKENTYRYVLATRTGAYSSKCLEGVNVQEMELMPFNEQQIRKFSQKYLRYLNASQLVERFLTELDKQPFLDELSKIPLFLGMLVKIYKLSETIPANISLLYREFINLIYEWEEKRGKNTFKTIKNSILSHLAFEMTKDGNEVYAFKDDVYKIIGYKLNILQLDKVADFQWTIDSVYEELVENRFLDEKDNMVGFLHQSMQEFFAAIELSSQQHGSYGSYLQDNRWDHSFVYLSGLLKDSSLLIEEILLNNKKPNLASVCFNSAQKVTDSVENKIIDYYDKEVDTWVEEFNHHSYLRELDAWQQEVLSRRKFFKTFGFFLSMRSKKAKRTLAKLFLCAPFLYKSLRCILCDILIQEVCSTDDKELLEMFKEPLLNSEEPCCETIKPYHEIAMNRYSGSK